MTQIKIHFLIITDMKNINAIKKAERAGYKVTTKDNHQFVAQKNNRLIEWFKNKSDEIFCIRIRSVKDLDDHMTDYCAGVFVHNFTSAIKINESR